MMAAGGGGAAPRAGSMAARVLSGPGRAAAGEAIGAAETAAGLENTVVPSLKRMTAKLELPKGQATVKDYITHLQTKVDAGTLTKQDLLEHHKLLGDLLADEPSGVAKFLSNRPSRLGKSGMAQAAKTDAKIVKQLNKATPGRADAAMDYRAAMLRNKGYKAAGTAAATYIAGDSLTDVLRKVFGGR